MSCSKNNFSFSSNSTLFGINKWIAPLKETHISDKKKTQRTLQWIHQWVKNHCVCVVRPKTKYLLIAKLKTVLLLHGYLHILLHPLWLWHLVLLVDTSNNTLLLCYRWFPWIFGSLPRINELDTNKNYMWINEKINICLVCKEAVTFSDVLLRCVTSFWYDSINRAVFHCTLVAPMRIQEVIILATS